MKTKIFAARIIACALFLNNHLRAQSTSGNNNTGANKFLGFNGAQNLEFRTNNTTRMQMMQNGNSTINGFTVNRSGFLGLSQDNVGVYAEIEGIILRNSHSAGHFVTRLETLVDSHQPADPHSTT